MIKKSLQVLVGLLVCFYLLSNHIDIFSTESDIDFSKIQIPLKLMPTIALTFDDGPHWDYTPEILEILKNEQVKATFFVVGTQVKLYPHLLKEINDAGHEIGNHTYSHPNLTSLENGRVREELLKNQNLILEITGKKPHYFRPPGGHYNYEVINIAKENGEEIALWSISPHDCDGPSSQVICQRILSRVQDKSIILLHSGLENTLKALPELIKKLKEAGFNFTTVSELPIRQSISGGGEKDHL